MVEKGFQVYGYDINEMYQQYAQMKGLRHFEPDLKYDCVYLSHTIEHWVELLEELQEIVSRYLTDGGFLLVEVPLIDRLLLGGRRDGIRGDTYFVHTWYFSVRSMDKLFDQLKCTRTYTDRASLCVYRYDAEREISPVESTPFWDIALRKMIDIGSLPLISRTACFLNRYFNYVDLSHVPHSGK